MATNSYKSTNEIFELSVAPNYFVMYGTSRRNLYYISLHSSLILDVGTNKNTFLIMHLHHIFLTVLTLAVSATSVKVHVYGGIKECEDSEKIKNKNVVKMHYTGTIASASKTGEKGKQFDSTLTRGTPVEFQIGSGQAMKGFEKGLLGLCKGVKVKLLIPPREGYGDRGVGDIPAGATLLFDIGMYIY